MRSKKNVSLALVGQEQKQTLAELTQQRFLEQLGVDTKALRRAARYLEPKRLKFTAIAVGGGVALLSALVALSRGRIYQAAVAREMKKQLAPLSGKLDRLEAQNEELRQQNEELQRQLKAENE